MERAGADGIFLRQCKGNKLFDNVVRTSGGNGIHIDGGSSDTLILNNVASGNGTAALPTGGEGLLVEGTQNLIERNALNSNAGFGLRFCFAGGSCANTFGRNMARETGGRSCTVRGVRRSAGPVPSQLLQHRRLRGSEQHVRRQPDPRTSDLLSERADPA